MAEPLDDVYLRWLYAQVASLRFKTPSRTYWILARQLFSKEFVWFVPNDDNRMEDGRDLRFEFIQELQLEDVDPDWLELGCSMFELLIGLSRRLSFEDEGEPREWFWRLLGNLGLADCTDAVLRDRPDNVDMIDETLDHVIWRTYSPDGRGGLFPLNNPQADQREVEIWYQLNAYLIEQD